MMNVFDFFFFSHIFLGVSGSYSLSISLWNDKHFVWCVMRDVGCQYAEFDIANQLLYAEGSGGFGVHADDRRWLDRVVVRPTSGAVRKNGGVAHRPHVVAKIKKTVLLLSRFVGEDRRIVRRDHGCEGWFGYRVRAGRRPDSEKVNHRQDADAGKYDRIVNADPGKSVRHYYCHLQRRRRDGSKRRIGGRIVPGRIRTDAQRIINRKKKEPTHKRKDIKTDEQKNKLHC